MIERKLASRLKNGEEKAFREIYETHFPKLYRYALTFTHSSEATEGIVQEVFMTLWQKRRSIDPDQSLNHYLYTLTKHRCFRFLKQLARDTALQQELASRLEIFSSNPENQVIYDQYHSIAQDAIRQLPPKRQHIYKMARQEGKSVKEIAQELGISMSTVKNQLLAATQAVRNYFISRSDHIISWILLLSAVCISA